MSGKTPRYDRQQRLIDWSRGAQLRALNDVSLPDRLVGLGSPVSRHTAMHILRIIDDHQREQETAWPSLRRIAQCAGLRSTKTVRRAFAALESLDLITVWNEANDKGHPRLVASINWEVIFGGRLAPKELPRQRRRGGTRPRNRGEPEDTVSTPEDTGSAPEDTVSTALYTKRPLKRPTEPLPLRPHVEHASAACLVIGWGEVEEELSRRGVKAFESAARTAYRYVDPEHVLALCEHYDRHASAAGWTSGHLYVRVCRARRWLAPDQGWPESTAAPPATRPSTSPPPVTIPCPHCGARPPHFRHPQGGGICSDCRRHFATVEELDT